MSGWMDTGWMDTDVMGEHGLSLPRPAGLCPELPLGHAVSQLPRAGKGPPGGPGGLRGRVRPGGPEEVRGRVRAGAGAAPEAAAAPGAGMFVQLEPIMGREREGGGGKGAEGVVQGGAGCAGRAERVCSGLPTCVERVWRVPSHPRAHVGATHPDHTLGVCPLPTQGHAFTPSGCGYPSGQGGIPPTLGVPSPAPALSQCSPVRSSGSCVHSSPC